MLLVGAFGVYQSVVQAQAATLTVTPVKAAVATTENVWICAKCGTDFAKFDISVTDIGADVSSTTVQTIIVKVTNADLGTLGTLTDANDKPIADSNPKQITLIENETNTGVFVRTVTAVNSSTKLVSDIIFGTADTTTTTTLLTSNGTLTAATLRDPDEGVILGGILRYTSGAASGEAREITGFGVSDGTVITGPFTGTPTAGDFYEIYPLVNLADFSGQALSISYTPSGGLGEATSITNDEVKATMLVTAPAENLITKKGSTNTIVFAADITDTGSGFPAKNTDLVINNNTAGNKGTIKLTLGTITVNLKKENFTAIDDGYAVTSSFTADQLRNLGTKLPWWFVAQDLAGNTQEPSGKTPGSSSSDSAAAADGTGTSGLIDNALANIVLTGAGTCPGCFEGRTVTVNVRGVDQTRVIDVYTPATGKFRFNDDGDATLTEEADSFSVTGTGNSTTTANLLIDSNLAGAAKDGLDLVGAALNIASTTAIVTAFNDTTGQVTANGNIFPAAGTAVAYTIFGIGFDSGTAFNINKTLLVTIDGEAPTVNTVVTGDNWKSTGTAGSRLQQATSLKAKSNSIRVTVTDTSGLDPASVVPSAFSISGGHTISSVLVVDVSGEDADPPVARVPNDIFITLGEDLSPSNERPTVTITGGVIMDKAGNSLGGTSPKAVDKLGPKLTVEMDLILSNSKVKATVTSDELLVSDASVSVKVLTSKTTGTLGVVPGGAPGNGTTQTGTLTYTKTVSTTALGTGVAGAMFNLYVEASDTGNNSGKAGHASDGTNASAATFEIDHWLNNGAPPQVLVADREAQATTVNSSATTLPAGQADYKVQAIDPMIVTLDFNKSCAVNGGAQNCGGKGESDEYARDSHKGVTLTKVSVKVTLSDGTSETTDYDVATQVSTPDNRRFTLPILSPKVGKYQLTLTAQDDAGNIALKNPTATTAESLKYDWEVTKISATKLSLSPGWNLISLPFQSSNPAINSLIPEDHPITIVMSYDNTTRVWLVSRRDAVTGLFTGDVAVMTADTAYFVLTTSFETLDILRPPLATAGAAPPVPPAISVFEGWNLVPVLSNLTKPPVGAAADTYFGTLGKTWLSALAWNPLTRTWTTVAPLSVEFTASASPTTDTFTDRCGKSYPAGTFTVAGQIVNSQVCIGEGLWLWVTEDGVLIP